MKRLQNKWTSTTEGRTLFSKIYRRHWAELLHHAENMTHDAEEAKDITASAFCTLLEKVDLFDREHLVRRFLFAVVANRSVDYLRKQMIIRRNVKEFKEFQLSADSNVQFCESNPVAMVVGEIIQQIETLPKGCAEVFRLSYFRQLSNVEIAAELSINEKTVRNQLSTARKILKAIFGRSTHNKFDTIETPTRVYS